MINKPFTNNPIGLYKTEAEQKIMKDMFAAVEKELGKEYPVVINGEEITTEAKITSVYPCKKDVVIGIVSKADKDMASKAVEAAYEKFQTWRYELPEKRAGILMGAARIMRERKAELTAWLSYETGKNWVESDAGIAEGIDFCEFYAREALRYAAPQPITKMPGEHNELKYIPLGVGAVIPPWNFPFAIAAGMTAAALVTGNTVVLKPASDTPVIAYKIFEIFKEAGIPDGVLNYLPGSGSEVGDTLVDHKLTRFLSFTGSRAVGTRIYERAAIVHEGQKWLKRVVAEMGGKDYIIVDRSANIKAAADDIVKSAYGFQGQKCSACSRAIIHKDVYDEVIELIVEGAKKIKMKDIRDFDSEVHYHNMGAVINEAAQEKILKYIEIGKKEGTLVLGGNKGPEEGFFVEPTVIKDIKPGAKIEQEEIFGPVLAVIKADDFNHAVEIANDTEYGLTGAVHSGCREHLEKGKKELMTGNLYFNRPCTAALVGVHPFGGFNMSGTDSKAGGRDYLLLFQQAKLMSEKVY